MNVPLLSNFAAAALLSAALGAQAFEALPAKPPVPAGNPMSKEKIELGKQLFFDPRLSADGTAASVRCAYETEALPAKPPVPAGNPMSKEKIELGKQLFFDPRLSADGTVSC